MRVYLAGPLFTVAERLFNESLALALERQRRSLQIVLPHRQAAALTGKPDFPRAMFEYCLRAIEDCDAIVALLDGADADSGTCVEMGYARARNKMVVGVRTDLRASEDRGLNLMVANICTHLILRPGPSTSVEELAQAIVEKLFA